MLLLWIAWAVLLAAAGAVILSLCSPVVATVDTQSRQVQIRWLVLLTFLWPLPRSGGSRQLRIAGMPIWLARRKRKGKRKRVVRRGRRSWLPSFLVRLFWRCLLDSGIRRSVAPQLARLLRGVLRSVELGRWRSTVSLPDPALNGLLAAALAQPKWGSKTQFLVNFTGENALQMELRLRPHRLAKALLAFLFRLPYKAIYKQCRTS